MEAEEYLILCSHAHKCETIFPLLTLSHVILACQCSFVTFEKCLSIYVSHVQRRRYRSPNMWCCPCSHSVPESLCTSGEGQKSQNLNYPWDDWYMPESQPLCWGICPLHTRVQALLCPITTSHIIMKIETNHIIMKIEILCPIILYHCYRSPGTSFCPWSYCSLESPYTSEVDRKRQVKKRNRIVRAKKRHRSWRPRKRNEYVIKPTTWRAMLSWVAITSSCVA